MKKKVLKRITACLIAAIMSSSTVYASEQVMKNIPVIEEDTSSVSMNHWYGCLYGVPVILSAEKAPSDLLNDDGFVCTENESDLGFDIPEEDMAEDISDFDGTWRLKYVKDKTGDSAESKTTAFGFKIMKAKIEDGNIKVSIAFADILSIDDAVFNDGKLIFSTKVPETNTMVDVQLCIMENNMLSINITAPDYAPAGITVFAEKK